MAQPRKYAKFHNFFVFFRPTQKIAWDGPKWGREVLFPANPDLADILDDMDLDLDNYRFGYFFEFKISGIPGSQISKIWSGPGLGRAGLEPSGPTNVDFLFQVLVFELATPLFL